MHRSTAFLSSLLLCCFLLGCEKNSDNVQNGSSVAKSPTVQQEPAGPSITEPPPSEKVDQTPKIEQKVTPTEVQQVKDQTNKVDQNQRPLVKFMNYFSKKEGFVVEEKAILPPGYFNAEDFIQFVIQDLSVPVLAAKYKDAASQEKGMLALRQLGVEGRRTFTVGLYTICVRGADENLDESLKDAIKEYDKF
ncbi:MAG: hypothetical protein JNN15_16340 [Blastocatellia bacterium]|nr:hypothetical protein [Blastocatellia bacterium]